MTNDDWKAVEKELSYVFGSVELLIDGFTVVLKVEQSGNLKFAIHPYVNGFFKGEWLTQKTEQCTRFMRPVQVAVYKPSEVKRLTQKLSKSAVKECFPNIDKKFTYYQWGWPSFAPMKRHFIANNKSIELKRVGLVTFTTTEGSAA